MSVADSQRIWMKERTSPMARLSHAASMFEFTWASWNLKSICMISHVLNTTHVELRTSRSAEQQRSRRRCLRGARCSCAHSRQASRELQCASENSWTRVDGELTSERHTRERHRKCLGSKGRESDEGDLGEHRWELSRMGRRPLS